MTLIQNIKQDLDNARRMKAAAILSKLTTLYSEASLVGKNDGNRESTDPEVVQTIKKFIKGINEILENVKDDARIPFLLEKELYEKYLPSQISTEELTKVINYCVEEYDYKTIGEIMKFIKTNYEGRYDSKLASQIIKEKLG